MSLLDNLPHRCTIQRRDRTKGSLGGSTDSFTNEQTDVSCWEQVAGHREITEYEKRGISINRKIYFTSDPSVTERHVIRITSRDGGSTTISSTIPLEVRSEAIPDASAGLGVVFKVMAEDVTSSRQ